MLSAVSEAKIDFLLVGAYAVAAHGHPRATGDLDLWVRPDIDLCVIGRADLILNKKASGRPKDLADVESLDPTGA